MTMELRHALRSTSTQGRELIRSLARTLDDRGNESAVSTNGIAELIAECAVPGETFIVGVTGSVAVGKTTFCNAIAGHLRSTQQIEIVSTDGFLLSNDALNARGLSMRKGYPESYDRGLMSGVLQRLRWGPVRIPGYSHRTYDLAPELDRTIFRPDIVLVEGLGIGPGIDGRDLSSHMDMLVYLDASEQDLETWFVERFLALWKAAESDPRSFYARFRSLSEDEADAFARSVWTQINLPNLRDSITRGRDAADLVVQKAADHRLSLVSA